MENTNTIMRGINRQSVAFGIAIAVFCVAAFIGWQKLQYGFNFIDEGYHMTEAWRLTAGDDFFKDKFTGALMSSTLINAVIFRAYPDITLLGFRELQFVVTIFSLLLLSYALFYVNRDYWYQPLIFSFFAFTGLDPLGMIKNLYYQTYPHLFITLHLAVFILGLYQKSPLFKKVFFILSGIFLWLISFSLLHMSLIIISPIALFIIIRRLNTEYIDFSFKDLCLVLAPFIVIWSVFLAIYNMAFILNVLYSLQLMLSTPTHTAGGLFSVNWEALKHIIISVLFLIACFFTFRFQKMVFRIAGLIIVSLSMYAVIETSFFGLITPYYYGWFSQPMWFIALLVAAYGFSICYVTYKIITKQALSAHEIIVIILLVPTIIMAVSSSIFSNLGILTILHSSIPAVAIIACLLLSDVFIGKRSYLEKLVVLTLILAPFYITTSMHAWNFTFFDVEPKKANARIYEGFGKGIRTNDAFRSLYDWIRVTSDRYTKKDDYILSYVVSPMVHMIAKRRPALDDPFISFVEIPQDYFIKAVAFMKEHRREPKLAFVFEAQPGLTSIPSRGAIEYAWFGDQFRFPSGDPLSLYVMQNMTPVASFKLQDRIIARCFIDNSSALDILKKEYKQDSTNPELNTQLGIIYAKRGDLNQAALYYKKAIAKSPAFIPALNQLAAVYKKQGNSEASLDTYKKIITIEPGHIDSYYNIACIYSGKNRPEESVRWLKKAIDRGFDNWRLLQTDNDLNNIRGTAYYKEVMQNVSTGR